jgi:hypothetical protein
VGSNLPPPDPNRQNVVELLALLTTIRQHAFSAAPPAEALIDIRDAIRQLRRRVRRPGVITGRPRSAS